MHATARGRRTCGNRTWLLGFVAVLVVLGVLTIFVGPSPASHLGPHRRSKGRHAIPAKQPPHRQEKHGHSLLKPVTHALEGAPLHTQTAPTTASPRGGATQHGIVGEGGAASVDNIVDHHQRDHPRSGGEEKLRNTSPSTAAATTRVQLPSSSTHGSEPHVAESVHPIDNRKRGQLGDETLQKPAALRTANELLAQAGDGGRGKGKGSKYHKHHHAAQTAAPQELRLPATKASSDDPLPQPRTYDDIIGRTLDPKYYVYPVPTSTGASPRRFFEFCNDVQVPFAPSVDERCIAFASAVADAASQASSLPAVVDVVVPSLHGAAPHLLTVNVSFDVLQQRFEQRTIKFRLACTILHHGKRHSSNNNNTTVDYGGGVVRLMLKVPQVLFPIEPFAEVAAFELDRKLRIHRVPPTALVALPIAWIKARSLQRAKADMQMVPEFLEASHVASYDEWIDKDFVAFVSNAKVARSGDDTRSGGEQQHHSRFTKNATHVWCSLQLFMREVQPILYSPLRVPYSKSNPGWHRWFDVEFHEYPVATGSLYALSQLAIFDCIIMNNDRSPNKNNFVVGGCKKCDPQDRRPSGLPPTLVHLDHGMSFYGKGFPISHNPLGKVANKVRFCIFYSPLVVVLRRLHDQVGRTEEGWRAFMLDGVNKVVAAVIGEDKVRDTGSQVVKVLKRLDYCLSQYNESAVLRP